MQIVLSKINESFQKFKGASGFFLYNKNRAMEDYTEEAFQQVRTFTSPVLPGFLFFLNLCSFSNYWSLKKIRVNLACPA